MSEPVADLFDPSCYPLFSGTGIEESQRLGPDLSSSRARGRAGGGANSRFCRNNSRLSRGKFPIKPQRELAGKALIWLVLFAAGQR
jgi:hypothetical protein